MVEHAKWQWQESGTAWRGVGVYHITLTVPSREPLFGTLLIPDEEICKCLNATGTGEWQLNNKII